MTEVDVVIPLNEVLEYTTKVALLLMRRLGGGQLALVLNCLLLGLLLLFMIS